MEIGWIQNAIIHCPDIKCRGMLLENDEYNYYQCSNCKKKYMADTRYIEVNE